MSKHCSIYFRHRKKISWVISVLSLDSAFTDKLPEMEEEIPLVNQSKSDIFRSEKSK